jgi:hypothetical protein
LADAIAAHGAPVVANESPAPEAPKARRGRPPKDASEPVAPAPAPAPAPLTYVQVARAVTDVISRRGQSVAVTVLREHGVTKLPDAKPEQWPAIVASCQAALAIEAA